MSPWRAWWRRRTPNELERDRRFHPRAGAARRPAGAGQPRAPGHAGAGSRHRVHRPGHRTDRRARRDRSRRAGPAGAWAGRPGGGAGGRAARRRPAHVHRAACARAAGGADRRAVRAGRLGGPAAAGEQPARRRAPEGPAGRPDPVGRHPATARTGRRGRGHGRPLRVARSWGGAPPHLPARPAVPAVLVFSRARGGPRRFGGFGFYAAFALAVTASVQLVGVYLVFTSLIVPALGTLRWRGRARLAVGYAVGAVGYAIGLALSAVLDLPSGPTVVCVLAAVALLSSQSGPHRPEASSHP